VSRFEQVVEVARNSMDELSVPGVALGVLFEGNEEVAGLGVTSVDNPLEVTPDTLFQIGSIGKTFVATAIMRLVEQGKLELDEPARSYLPDFRLEDEDTASRVTVRQLLTHTGGWVGDYFADFGAGDDALARMVDGLSTLPQLTPLGAHWSYNNSAFYVAGRIIEVTTGEPFEKALGELVLQPLGLEHSFFFPDDVMTHRFAVGHELDADGNTVVARPWWIGRSAHAAGGIVSTVPELLRYARFWIEGGDLLSAGSVDEMTRPQVPIGGEYDAVGLAWFLREREGVRVISHGGGTKGQISLLAIASEQGFAFVALTNHQWGGPVAERVFDAATDAYLGFREPELTAVDMPAERLSEYLGRYESKLANAELVQTKAGLEFRYELKGGFPTPDTPAGPNPPPDPVAFASEDEVFVPDGPFKGDRARFLRDADGRIEWLRLGGRLYAPLGSRR
jgi:CubicO group peptidase (beta-lactamase class C family)